MALFAAHAHLFTNLVFYGGAVASWLVRSTPVRVRALAWDIVLCSWARRATLAVPLYTQVYKWVPTNLILGVTLRWTSIPSREGGGRRVEILVASCYRNPSNLWTNGPLDSCADLLNTLQVLSCSNLVIDTWFEKHFYAFSLCPGSFTLCKAATNRLLLDFFSILQTR